LCDPESESAGKSYWVQADLDTHQGSDKEPWFPRPLIQQVELQMPLLNLDNPQGKLEEM
jgi:chromosome transmission fidelity protein 4